MITRYLPPDVYQFICVRVDKNKMEVLIIKDEESWKPHIMSISLTDNNWKVIKRRLDMFLNEVTFECAVCEDFEGRPKNSLLHCNKCGQSFCVYCYTDIMRVNNGKIICPFCRHETGSTQHSHVVEQMIKKIHEKIPLIIKNNAKK